MDTPIPKRLIANIRQHTLRLFAPDVQRLVRRKDVEGLAEATHYGLENIRYGATVALLGFRQDPDAKTREAATELLETVDLAQLFSALNDPTTSIREGAAATLSAKGEVVVRPLLESIISGKGEIAASAGQIISKTLLGKDEVRRFLASCDAKDRSALNDIVRSIYMPRLASGLEEYNSATSEILEVIKLMGEQGDRLLIDALSSDAYAVAYGAANALLWLKHDAAVGILQDALRKNPRFGGTFIAAIGRHGYVSCAISNFVELSHDPVLRKPALQALTSCRHAPTDPFVAAMSDIDWGVRAIAVRFLGGTGDRNHLPTISQAIFDESVYVCQDAAKALGQLGDETVIEPLIAI